MAKGSFGSDNHAGIHPQILEALLSVNTGHAPAYGTDSISMELEKQFCDLFKTNLKCFLLFNGTGCNVVGLRGLVSSFQSVLCSDCAHLWEDECAAPEVVGGFKLIPVESKSGKIQTAKIDDLLVRKGDQHFAQVRALSITQPTEYGTVYSLEELREIRRLCDQHNLFLHIDGARFAQSLHYLNLTMDEFYRQVRPDVISFGGTKNGLLLGEALLVFRPERFEAYKYLRKQCLQLPSKSRFLAAQFLAYLRDDLFNKIAKHQHEMAVLLGAGLAERQFPPTFPVESNAVFVNFTKDAVSKLTKHSFIYVWNEKTFLSRLMCSFDTQEHDIKSFLEHI